MAGSRRNEQRAKNSRRSGQYGRERDRGTIWNLSRRNDSNVRSCETAVVDLVDRQSLSSAASRSSRSRSLRERSWDLLCRRSVQRQTDSRALSLESILDRTPLGEGVFRRRRTSLGNELDDGFHESS